MKRCALLVAGLVFGMLLARPAVIADGELHTYQPINQKINDAIWQVRTDSGVGTAFCIGAQKAVTAAHVVEGGGAVTLHRGEESIQVTAVTILAGDDIALLALKEKVKSVLCVSAKRAYWGQPVAIVGGPFGLDSLPTVGYAAYYKDDFYSWRKVLVCACKAAPGNSGSPLIDLNTGKVLGIVVGGMQHITVVEPIDKISGVK